MTNYQHIAEQMYAAYCQQAGGLTFDGKPLPSFQELGLERQTCWRAAACGSKMVAPVVLPEPDSYLFQHEDTGQTMFVDAQQVEWGFEANNPRLHKVSGVYTEQQVRALLAKDLDAVNLDRLGKALTKLGHATWVSQEEAAADTPRWVNALTSCVLEIPEAAEIGAAAKKGTP